MERLSGMGLDEGLVRCEGEKVGRGEWREGSGRR